MKIVVVSDTHMPRMSRKLPDRLIRELRSADRILHAGDWTDASVYGMLTSFAPTIGVAGNNDGADLVRKFGWMRKLELEGCRIGIVHGHGPGGRSDTEERALAAFQGDRLDVIVFGHSHIPVHKQAGKLLVFNPGSPTDKRRQPLFSFGILHVSGGVVKAEHIFYEDKK